MGQEIRNYSARETATILGISLDKFKNFYKCKKWIVPTDVEKARGAQGFRYVFSTKSIEEFAHRVGLTVDYDRLNMARDTAHENIKEDTSQDIKTNLYAVKVMGMFALLHTDGITLGDRVSLMTESSAEKILSILKKSSTATPEVYEQVFVRKEIEHK